jgi:Ankyrin repeats (3 copies)
MLAPNHEQNVKRFVLPLHAAASYPKICGVEMVRYLHSKGANLEAVDELGRNVMHYIARSQGAQGEALKIAKFLLRHGVDYQLKDHAGKTPLDLYEVKSILSTYDTRVEDYLRFGIQLERPKNSELENGEQEEGQFEKG